MALISYTLPCHKRLDDLKTCFPSVRQAAIRSLPVEVIVVDYGNDPSLNPDLEYRVVRCEAKFFHMAHARNVGIQAAQGEIIVAFLADQILHPNFFSYVRESLQLGTFLQWKETFVFWREDILEAGGFDERFEFYGPEGKELSDRLQRNGLKKLHIPDSLVSQLRTPNEDKLKNYRLSLSKWEMHLQGMAIWKENQSKSLLTANQGMEWGRA